MIMHIKTVVTIWMLLSLTGSRFSTVSAGEINVAPGSSCTTSTEFSNDYRCEKAIDGDITTGYYSNWEGVGMWYMLYLDSSHQVNRLRIMDLPNNNRKNKELRLQFSDGSSQEVTFPTHGEGKYWTDFPITPVTTHSVLITVISVYSGSLSRGFQEIEIFADVVDCASNPCDVNAGCVNTPGSFTCTCFPGFDGNGLICTDVDECVSKTSNCNLNAGCVNTPGSYNCTCFPGFKGNGSTCNDVDECDLKTDNCSARAECVNTPGIYNCTCLPGFIGDGFKCIDVDECVSKNNNCSVNAGCVNSAGSYNCTCFPGFNGDGFKCIDTDECTLKTGNCSVNAECVNTPGIYNCTCFPGFSGDDVDECDLKTDNCSARAGCMNTPGSHNCTCLPGYNGDGFKCTDVSSINQIQYCRCPCPKNLTKEESKAFVAEILESLTINSTKVSANRRKRISAPDGRVSAQSFGYGGTAIFVIVFGVIFLSDLPRLLTDFKQLIHNLRNIGR